MGDDLCNDCGVNKSYHKNGKCKSCQNTWQRLYRRNNGNKVTKNYEKTPKGYLMRTYRNMLSRVKGVLKKKAHLYEGLEILNKEQFYEWSLSSNYIQLLEAYKESGWDMKLAPSIDRKDPEKGYTLENIRWITHSNNSSCTRHSGKQYEV